MNYPQIYYSNLNSYYALILHMAKELEANLVTKVTKTKINKFSI